MSSLHRGNRQLRHKSRPLGEGWPLLLLTRSEHFSYYFQSKWDCSSVLARLAFILYCRYKEISVLNLEDSEEAPRQLWLAYHILYLQKSKRLQDLSLDMSQKPYRFREIDGSDFTCQFLYTGAGPCYLF